MLELKHISKTFFPGTVNAKTALDDLSLTLYDGDFVTVIGGNGAGKSTMLNAVAGTLTVDSGSILLDGEDITHKPEHRRAADLGRVFQDPMMGTAGDMWIEEIWRWPPAAAAAAPSNGAFPAPSGRNTALCWRRWGWGWRID